MLASADIAKITRQIQAIQSAKPTGTPTPRTKGRPPLLPLAAMPPKRQPTKVKPAERAIVAASPARVGEAIAAARDAAGLSRLELADKLKTKRQAIDRLETKHDLPSTRTLQRIAKATGHELQISFVKRGR